MGRGSSFPLWLDPWVLTFALCTMPVLEDERFFSRAIFLRGKAITMSFFVHRIRDLLQLLGFPAHHYAGHSFSIGAATTAALVGMEDSMIQTLGRWHSAAPLRYIRTPKAHLANASASLVDQAGTALN